MKENVILSQEILEYITDVKQNKNAMVRIYLNNHLADDCLSFSFYPYMLSCKNCVHDPVEECIQALEQA